MELLWLIVIFIMCSPKVTIGLKLNPTNQLNVFQSLRNVYINESVDLPIYGIGETIRNEAESTHEGQITSNVKGGHDIVIGFLANYGLSKVSEGAKEK